MSSRGAVGIQEEVERGVRIPVGRGFAGRVAAKRNPVVLGDVDHAQVLNPLLREKGIKSLLGVPLLVGGRPTGVLHVGTLSPRSFTAEDVEMLQFAADRAAIAIEHARVFEMERAAGLRVEHVQAVTDAALAHLAFDELMAVLLPRIRSILHADTSVVLLLDDEHQKLVVTRSGRARGGSRAGRPSAAWARFRRPGREGEAADRSRRCRYRRRRQPDPSREGSQVDGGRAAARQRRGDRRVAHRHSCASRVQAGRGRAARAGRRARRHRDPRSPRARASEETAASLSRRATRNARGFAA
jgi:GAF domain-containing protein